MITNTDTYRKLVAEDIEWLKTTERTLERDHIILILENQIRDAEYVILSEHERVKKLGIHK